MATGILQQDRKIVRTALYARVSTKDKGQETENQLRQLREFAATQGWTITREYVDRESGLSDERAEFQAMFQDASQRKFDVLLFWALDRLSREGVLETLQHLNRLTSYGVGYRSLTEQYFDSCGIFREAVIAIIATVARQQSVRLSERVKAGLERARSQGKVLGRPGIRVDAREIADMRAQGNSIRQIAARFGCSASYVHKMLANLQPVSAGPAAD